MTLRKSGRRPASAPTPGRQEIWAAIRKTPDRFTLSDLVARSGANRKTVSDYLRCLIPGGIIQAEANIAQVLLNLIPDQQWGLDDELMPAEAVTEEPLVSIDANKQGLALTAVLWEQVAALSPFPASEPITPEVYLGQMPQIGAAHEDDYQLIGGAP